MHSEISRESTQNMRMKMKQRHYIQSIMEKACLTGVADITLVARDFNTSNDRCREAALAAIEAAASQKHVHVLDVHGLTVLFDFPVFQKVLKLLEHSYVFAINMGEDSGKFDQNHFALLASKILDGSSAVRRWFVESNKSRRTTLVDCGLVSAPNTKNNQTVNKGNVFTQARNADHALWEQGNRETPRLAWLLAPESAFKGATAYNTGMQNTTCNWDKACAITNARGVR
jgi:hypothetical protein